MASTIYVTSAEGRSGKSTVAVGLLEALKGTVERLGVFRPVARSQQESDYVLDLLLEHSTAGLDAALCTGTDYTELHEDPDAAMARIIDRFAAVEQRCDAVLILGSDYTDVGTPTELATNARIAADLAAPVVVVLNGRDASGDGPRTASEVSAVARVAVAELRAEHAEVAAVIVNRADAAESARIAEIVGRDTGLPTWAIPEDAELTAPLLRTVLAAVDGELLSGDPALLDRPVRGTVVAAMTLENVLPRLLEGSVVVVPGDRSDVLVGTVVAHLSTTFPSLAGIVLNGGFPVAPDITRLLGGLGAALPIARCSYGTYDTAVRIIGARSKLAADSPQKYATAVGLFENHVDAEDLLRRLSLSPATVMTPARFEHSLVERARATPRRIVLPEGDDDRVLQAASIVLRRGIAELIILGEELVVRGRAAELGLDLAGAQVISPRDPELHARFSDEYFRLRESKGVSRELAEERMADVAYFGTMLVHDGLADGMVSGAVHTTAHTIRPAFEIVRTAPGVSVVSSVFLMALADRVLVYGDCAVIPDPTSEQLADIAISSAATARQFGIDPRVAMLSYSTGESGSGTEVEKVRAATELVRSRAPELPVAGPIQYDAAADPTVGASKMPGSEVAGRATVFVFPDLNTGNNTYKAVQRSAGAVAIGPVLQGLAKPINDLSRGALVRDIVNTIAITAIQAQGHVVSGIRSVFVLNTGSSSVKYRVVNALSGEVAATGLIERIGEPGSATPDHQAAIARILDELAGIRIDAVGHRIVHGGNRYVSATVIDAEVEAGIDALAPLAPLHNPPGLLGIRAARAALPELPQVAVFDTAFHATIPAAARTYALDAELAAAHGIRRYGFHGTSYRIVAERTAAFLGRPLEELRMIVLHLGNGASAAAISGGRSIDTSMGMTPLEGLVMGTRSGDLDPAVLLYLQRNAGLDVDELDTLLNRRSGLLGLSGHSDMREVTTAAETGDPAATLALDVYLHRLRHYIGAYAVELGGLDALVFTAGVGENSAVVRAGAVEGLGILGIEVDAAANAVRPSGSGSDTARRISPASARVPVLVIPTDEELQIARETATVLAGA